MLLRINIARKTTRSHPVIGVWFKGGWRPSKNPQEQQLPLMEHSETGIKFQLGWLIVVVWIFYAIFCTYIHTTNKLHDTINWNEFSPPHIFPKTRPRMTQSFCTAEELHLIALRSLYRFVYSSLWVRQYCKHAAAPGGPKRKLGAHFPRRTSQEGHISWLRAPLYALQFIAKRFDDKCAAIFHRANKTICTHIHNRIASNLHGKLHEFCTGELGRSLSSAAWGSIYFIGPLEWFDSFN